MASSEFIQHIKGKQAEISGNVEKLNAAIYTEKFTKLSDKQQQLLEQQFTIMTDYQRNLRLRLAEVNGFKAQET